MTTVTFSAEDNSRAMDAVQEAIEYIGYTQINPESLSALQDELYNNDGWVGGKKVRGSFSIVMHGFRQLFLGA